MGCGSSTEKEHVKLSKDRVVVITGANTGIGYQMAKEISYMGATVIIACRSEEKAREAIDRMKSEHESVTNKQTDELHLEFMKLDLSSLASAKEFIQAYKDSGRPLHVLAANAGIFATPWGHTEDGYERQFQVNYLGHFLIIAHLLPIMQQSGEDCRIVMTSSDPLIFKAMDLENVQAPNERKYNRMTAYGWSKMFQAMQTTKLSEILGESNVTVTSFNPGPVATDVTRNVQDSWIGTMTNLFSCLYKPPEEGARSGVFLAVSPTVKGESGGFYFKCKRADPGPQCRNAAEREKLWTYTTDLLKDSLPVDFAKMHSV